MLCFKENTWDQLTTPVRCLKSSTALFPLLYSLASLWHTPGLIGLGSFGSLLVSRQQVGGTAVLHDFLCVKLNQALSE